LSVPALLWRKGNLVKRASIASLVVLLPLYVACTATSANKPAGGAAAPSGASQQLTIKSLDTMKFDPTTLTAKAGQPIQATLDNTGGQIAHDFDITEAVPQPIKISAQPGQKATATFTIDTPGSYTFFCSQPGHEQAGMKGTLTVN
jgi:nitrite reductase (NO-forming)